MAMCEEIARPNPFAIRTGRSELPVAIRRSSNSCWRLRHFCEPAGAGMDEPPGPPRRRALRLSAVEDGAGGYAEAARLGVDIDLTVVAAHHPRPRHADLPQPDQRLIQAVYVYPLAEAGAVDSLDGDRRSHRDRRHQGTPGGAHRLRAGAREGRKAALTEQERPNIFTDSVANIGPGETVLVQIEYQEPVPDRRASSRCASRSSSGRATIRRRGAERRPAPGRNGGWRRSEPIHRSGAGPRPHRAAGARPRVHRRSIRRRSACALRPASRSAR